MLGRIDAPTRVLEAVFSAAMTRLARPSDSRHPVHLCGVRALLFHSRVIDALPAVNDNISMEAGEGLAPVMRESNALPREG